MFKKICILLIYNIVLINSMITKPFEPISDEENEASVNMRLNMYIERFDMIEKSKEEFYNNQLRKSLDSSSKETLFHDKEKYKTELQLLKATYEMALMENIYEEKVNLLNNFIVLLPDGFACYILDELDKLYINEKIRMEREYLMLMNFDLQDIGFWGESLNIDMELKEACQMKELQGKTDKYTNIIEGLSPRFKEFLDQQPPNEILLKGHLTFLFNFIHSLEPKVEEFQVKLLDLKQQLELAFDSVDIVDKVQFIDDFNDVSTKFGRYLSEQFIEFKFNRYGNW